MKKYFLVICSLFTFCAYGLDCQEMAEESLLNTSDRKVENLFLEHEKLNSKMCNDNISKALVSRLENIHICLEIKQDESLEKTKINSGDRFKCSQKTTTLEIPEYCLNQLNDINTEMLALLNKIENRKENVDGKELEEELMTIYISRLIVNKQRASGRGKVNAYLKNNLVSIPAGLLVEGFDLEMFNKYAYLVCVEQVYNFIESPEARYLRFRGYTTHVFDETPKKDKTGKTTHAFILLENKNKEFTIFDPWKGETGEFKESEYKSSKGIKEGFTWKPSRYRQEYF